MKWGWKSITGCIGFGLGAVLKAAWPENQLSEPLMGLAAALAGIGVAHKVVKIQRKLDEPPTPANPDAAEPEAAPAHNPVSEWAEISSIAVPRKARG